MIATRKCRKCGAELSADVFRGLCPTCLAELALNVAAKDSAVDATSSDSPSKLAAEELQDSSSESLPSRHKLGRFGDYELLEEIAYGGMGVVYKARQISLDRIVAVKVLLFGPLASREYVQRFRTEASAAASLQHSNIVAIHEVGVHEGQHYFAMDFVEGRSLAKVVAAEGPLPAKRAAQYVKTIAEAIHYAHEHGILHRDLKPSNILIDNLDRPRVTDFGLAKRLEGETELTVTGQVLGSPNYLPPEQAVGARGKVSRRSDVYALGGILYHLLTGRPPFVGETLTDTLHQVLNTDPPSPRLLNPSVPTDLETVCSKCLEKEPAKRYQTTQALAEELGRFLRDEPIHARPVSRPERVWRWCKRKPVVASLAAAVIVLLLAVAVGAPVALMRIHRERRQVERERRAVEAKAVEARQNLYLADMRLAKQAFDADNFGLGMESLRKHIPKEGEKDFRGFEWRYLWRLGRGDEALRISGLNEWVTSLAVSPDGDLLAVVTRDRRLRFWDLASRRFFQVLQEQGKDAYHVRFSPDGKWFVKAQQRAVTVYKLPDWQVHRTLDDSFGQLAFSPNGECLGAQCASGVKVWGTVNWEERGRVPAELNSYLTWDQAMAFSPDGRFLATAAPNGQVKVWDLDSWIEAANLSGHGERVTCVAWSPDGQIIVSGYEDGLVTLWDESTRTKLGDLEGHHNWIGATSFTGGNCLVTAGADHTIKVWDLMSKSLLRTLKGLEDEVNCLAATPDGSKLITGGKDETVCIWNLHASPKSNVVFLPHPATSADAVFFAEGGSILIIASAAGVTHIWDCKSRMPLPATSKVPPGTTPMALSPDEKFLAGRTGVGEVKIWNFHTQDEVSALSAGTNQISRLIFSRNGGLLAGWDEHIPSIQLWHAPVAQPLARLDGHKGGICQVVFSPDGSVLASGSKDWTIKLWDLKKRVELGSLSGHKWMISALAFSADGRILASGSGDGTLRLWDAVKATSLAVLKGSKSAVFSLAFSPDGKTLAAGTGGDNLVKLWNVPSMLEMVALGGHSKSIWHVAFSPDENLLISAGDDKTVRFWDAPVVRGH